MFLRGLWKRFLRASHIEVRECFQNIRNRKSATGCFIIVRAWVIPDKIYFGKVVTKKLLTNYFSSK